MSPARAGAYSQISLDLVYPIEVKYCLEAAVAVDCDENWGTSILMSVVVSTREGHVLGGIGGQFLAAIVVRGGHSPSRCPLSLSHAMSSHYACSAQHVIAKGRA